MKVDWKVGDKAWIAQMGDQDTPRLIEVMVSHVGLTGCDQGYVDLLSEDGVRHHRHRSGVFQNSDQALESLVPSIKSLHLEYDEAIEALIQKKLNLDSKVCKLKGFDPKNLECKLTYSRVLQR